MRVYASGEADGCHFIAMELIEGEDLGRRLKRDGALPATEALRIGLAVAEGLQHGWQNAHLIHRDIKPANIFLAADGAVKLGDLGLAKSLLGNTSGLTQSGTMMGTPHYISPEQARADKDLDFRADIYSLGCTLFQTLTGQVPYGGGDAITIIRQHLDAPLPAILKVWPQCPLPLARLVGKMLKKARPERHGSYEELIAQMKSVWAQIDPVGFEPESFAPPVRRAASAADERPPSAPLPPPPARSPLPLYGGLAAGVAVLAVVAWLAWPKTEQLTQAQLVMAQRAAAKSAAPATPAPPAAPVAEHKEPAASASTAPEPAAIKLWDSPEKIPQREGYQWEDNAVRLKDPLYYSKPVSRDAIIRASIRMNPDAQHPQIALRQSGKSQTSEERCYQLVIHAKDGNVRLDALMDSHYRNLKEWRLPRAYGADEWAQLELRAVGDALTASLDGQVLGTVHDTSITEPGGVHIHAAANGYFRDIEYVPLDGAAAGNAALSTLPSPSMWKKVPLPDAEALRRIGASVNTEGELHFVAGKQWGLSGIRGRNLAFRWEVQGQSDFKEFNIVMRKGNPVRRQFTVFPGDVRLELAADNKHPTLAKISNPAQGDIGKWVPIQFAVVNEASVATIGAVALPVARSPDALESGGVSLGIQGAALRNLEYQILDDVPEAQWPEFVRAALAKDAASTGSKSSPAGASSAAATKDAPFVNSLGMKFMPVAGTRVLFSIWDTRVRDYAAYARVKKVDSSWQTQEKEGVQVSREPEYPVVGVSWDDAQAFCQWLTEKETTEGKLPKGARYRLATDEEWSRAVGLPPEAGTTPAEKSEKDTVHYPWGTGFPPKSKVGNYADSAWHEKFPTKKWIEGYTDGFATTAPVGSFPANPFGLYDMGGNVWCWCEDRVDAPNGDRVLRGGGWLSPDRSELLSSHRSFVRSTNSGRYPDLGFRCVLEPAPAAPK